MYIFGISFLFRFFYLKEGIVKSINDCSTCNFSLCTQSLVVYAQRLCVVFHICIDRTAKYYTTTCFQKCFFFCIGTQRNMLSECFFFFLKKGKGNVDIIISRDNKYILGSFPMEVSLIFEISLHFPSKMVE